MSFRYSLLGLAVAILSGCAMPTLTQNQMQSRTKGDASSAIEAFRKEGLNGGSVREIATPMPDFKRTEAPRVRGDVTLNAASVPFAPILSEVGRKAGYSVAYAENVDINRKVTANFNGAVSEDAIRTTAFLAGYVAVIDKHQRTVMVSDIATYTFKLPATVFTALSAQYTVGGNSSSSGSAGAGSQGSSLKADFSITGKDNGNSSGIAKFLTELAGRNAAVVVSDSGHISVRANAQALRRVHDFMRGFARDAMSQVEIEASVIEVSLAKEFALGIQWGQVLDAASRGAVIGGAATGAADVLARAVSQTTGGGLSAFKVDASSSSLINALAQFTEVNIVSQPKLLSMNNVPATFFDGVQIPYLGSVQQTPSATAGGLPTVTGTVAFAIDGVSFSAVPSVIDERTVQVTLMPVLSSVNEMKTFLNGTLSVPSQGNRQTFMRVLAESGKTLILGGIRYNKDTKQTSVPSSVSNSSSAKEVVILLRTKVIPAPNFDPIVNESL
jgi:hypothetical protein